MEIISNLEKLNDGDWVKIYEKGYQHSERFKIAEIEAQNTKVIHIITRQESRGWDRENKTYPDEKLIILKIKEKITKRKLKHKTKTYNSQYIIFKLNEREKNKLINESMLRELEREVGNYG